MIQTSILSTPIGNLDNQEYDAYLRKIQERFLLNVGAGAALFTTDAEGLWEAYILGFTDDTRQYHNCHACRHFINRFGGLVAITSTGRTVPAIWSEEDAPEWYKASVRAMERIVRRARVTGVFLASEKVWGSPVTGVWTHFSVVPPESRVYNNPILTAGQAMAAKLEDFRTVQRALSEFSLNIIDQALSLLQTESLYRSEKVIGPAQWLRDLHAARASVKGSQRDCVVWGAVATAPPGFCHPRSSMIGSLLEDIAAGLPFSTVSRRFADKMHPLQYQRPQTAPDAGNIAQAEKVVEKLGIASSLRRRFARIEDVQALWVPKQQKEELPEGGVFSHLLSNKNTQKNGVAGAPAVTMTWDKFQRTVLPTALEIEFLVARSDNYCALVTAVDPSSPPILQWDRDDHRNPVSWYLWHNGSPASQWGLIAGEFCKVSVVTLKPSMWFGGNEHQGAGVMFLLDGAKESKSAGLALFPEILRTELREVRATIEAFSRNGVIEGMNEASACGVSFMKGGTWSNRFRVRTTTSVVEYKLDRWD